MYYSKPSGSMDFWSRKTFYVQTSTNTHAPHNFVLERERKTN